MQIEQLMLVSIKGTELFVVSINLIRHLSLRLRERFLKLLKHSFLNLRTRLI